MIESITEQRRGIRREIGPGRVEPTRSSRPRSSRRPSARARMTRLPRAVRLAVAVPFALFAALAFFTTPQPAAAQDPVLDSLVILFDSLTAALLDSGPRHAIGLRPVFRRYTVGGASVSEQAVGLTYTLRTGSYTVRLGTSGPLRFSNGRTTIDAVTPVEASVDVRLGVGDSLRLTARSASFPGSLDSHALQALANVGTSTVELESVGLGTPAVGGVRVVVSEDVGPITAALRFAAEVEPRPNVLDSVYWRGATVRAGLGITKRIGRAQVAASVEVWRSYADSLDGRNLFPGGGGMVARAEADASLGEFGEVLGFGSAYYYQPLNVERPDQPNRRIPIGSVYGGYAGFMLPIGSVYLVPVLGVARESNSGELDIRRFEFQSNGSSWALTASSSLSIPFGSHFFLTPEAGFTLGGVRGEFIQLQMTDLRPIELRFADDVDGWYTALELSVTF